MKYITCNIQKQETNKPFNWLSCVTCRKSFTLIEMLVTIGVIGLTLPALSAIILAIFQQQVKIYALTEVKKQGDYAVNSIANSIRSNALSIHTDIPSSGNEICKTTGVSGTPVYFKDKNGKWFRYYLNNSKIIVESNSTGILVTQDLVSSKVKVTNFSLSCNRSNSFSPPLVHIQFDTAYNTASGRQEEIISLSYQTNVKLKSY